MDGSVWSELVKGILSIMENRLVSIILYGSVARGTGTEESDVDIALIMHGKMDAEIEDKLSDFVVDLDLKYDRVFSVIDIDAEHFRQWISSLPFYQNIVREGVILWRAN